MRTIEEYQHLLWNRQLDRPLLYQPLEHPAFRDWEAQQPCIERWRMLGNALWLALPSKLLDLGCHTGWFCRAFSRHGWRVVGIDKDLLAIEIASELMRPWDGEPAPEYRLENLADASLPAVDVALCLSLVMYLFPEPGWELLDRVSRAAPIMFLDFGGQHAERCPFTATTIGDEILERTQYATWRQLGETALENRPFYVFER